MPEVRHLHDNDNIIVVNSCIRHTANGTVGLGRGPEGGECHVRWNVATGDIRPHTRVLLIRHAMNACPATFPLRRPQSNTPMYVLSKAT